MYKPDPYDPQFIRIRRFSGRSGCHA